MVYCTENALITAGLDNQLKIWSYQANQPVALFKNFHIESCVQSFLYIEETLCFLDQEAYLTLQKLRIPPYVPVVPEEPEKVEIQEKQMTQEKVEQKIEPLSYEPKMQEERELTLADQLIDFEPHPQLLQTTTSTFAQRRFLAYSLFASISLREESEFSFIDIEFANKQSRKNIILPNTLQCDKALCSPLGALLASSTQLSFLSFETNQ
jgi:hypothetical protein